MSINPAEVLEASGAQCRVAGRVDDRDVAKPVLNSPSVNAVIGAHHAPNAASPPSWTSLSGTGAIEKVWAPLLPHRGISCITSGAGLDPAHASINLRELIGV